MSFTVCHLAQPYPNTATCCFPVCIAGWGFLRVDLYSDLFWPTSWDSLKHFRVELSKSLHHQKYYFQVTRRRTFPSLGRCMTAKTFANSSVACLLNSVRIRAAGYRCAGCTQCDTRTWRPGGSVPVHPLLLTCKKQSERSCGCWSVRILVKQIWLVDRKDLSIP